jgi:hypothetical protein
MNGSVPLQNIQVANSLKFVEYVFISASDRVATVLCRKFGITRTNDMVVAWIRSGQYLPEGGIMSRNLCGLGGPGPGITLR